MEKQQPGKLRVFLHKKTNEIDAVILPNSFGESNEKVSWRPCSSSSNSRSLRGGFWISTRFKTDNSINYYHENYSFDLHYRMKRTVRALKTLAKKQGYRAPSATAEQMLSGWLSQDGKCAACKGPLVLFNGPANDSACYDHNHETGEPRGFVHRRCNTIEGMFLKMSGEEFLNFVDWVTTIRSKRPSQLTVEEAEASS